MSPFERDYFNLKGILYYCKGFEALWFAMILYMCFVS